MLDYLTDPDLEVRNAAISFIKDVAVGTLFRASTLLNAILHNIESPSERVRQAAITCLSEHVHEKESIERSHKFYDLISNVKAFIAQVVSDVMISDIRCPTLHMYSEEKEDLGTKVAAFTLLYEARFVSHEAVCNAVLALESTEEDLLAAATAYLVQVALIAEHPDQRLPAISAIGGMIDFKYIRFMFKILSRRNSSRQAKPIDLAFADYQYGIEAAGGVSRSGSAS